MKGDFRRQEFARLQKLRRDCSTLLLAPAQNLSPPRSPKNANEDSLTMPISVINGRGMGRRYSAVGPLGT